MAADAAILIPGTTIAIKWHFQSDTAREIKM
jgi:hypothetical protein